MEKFPVVLHVPEEISSVDARGLRAQIDLAFNFQELFGNTKLLSDLLQVLR